MWNGPNTGNGRRPIRIVRLKSPGLGDCAIAGTGLYFPCGTGFVTLPEQDCILFRNVLKGLAAPSYERAAFKRKARFGGGINMEGLKTLPKTFRKGIKSPSGWGSFLL